MKKILVALLSVLCVFAMAGCYKTSEVKKENSYGESMFVVVEETGIWRIVYHKETKVMYAVSYKSYNYGNFTLLVDENGNPMLWEN